MDSVRIWINKEGLSGRDSRSTVLMMKREERLSAWVTGSTLHGIGRDGRYQDEGDCSVEAEKLLEWRGYDRIWTEMRAREN